MFIADKLGVNLGVVVVLGVVPGVDHVLQSLGADHYTATILKLYTVSSDSSHCWGF